MQDHDGQGQPQGTVDGGSLTPLSPLDEALVHALQLAPPGPGSARSSTSTR